MADILDGPRRPASSFGFDPDLVRAAELVFNSDSADVAKAAGSTLNKRFGVAAADVQATADWILARTGQLQAEIARLRAQTQNWVLDRKLREGYELQADRLERRIEKALASPAPSPRLLLTKAAKDADEKRRNALRQEARELHALADRVGPDLAYSYRRKAWAAEEAAGR